MRVVLLIFLLTVSKVDAKILPNKLENVTVKDEPRIFFKQIMEASGIFPIEINVPDTISAMISGMNSMYESMSTYFISNGSQQEELEQQVRLKKSKVELGSRPSSKHRRKKLNKRRHMKEKIFYNLLDLFNLLMF
ncbi:CLUMA_CG011465, isoform A [Clunio marinus]|uniref:CLUMA_CG011465, isoform A n=1 Tax=Clunio marinus TaxID=568069 RepID=A0A1J1II19_9DIPT|nr:CLUMA_CG011465, isoform A [Clunio marinus]